MNTIRVISIFLAIILLNISCRDEFTLCTQSKEVKFNAAFFEKTGSIDIPKSAPTLTINPLGDPLAVVNGIANAQTFSLQLSSLVDTSKFVISISNTLRKDTIKIVYTSQNVLLSVDCGNIINYNIIKILSTKNTLDTVKITNPLVNTGLVQNAKFYF
jgi:hypothetical protein